MNVSFYPRLAQLGMEKNKQLYRPYRFACAGMVMMCYLVSFLATSSSIKSLSGGETVQSLLVLGQFIIAVFALVFLFYTHSFLIRRRKKEFGLYNVLGMGKRHLAYILIWETLLVLVRTLAAGIVCGIAFSKLAELALLNAVKVAVNYELRLEPKSILETVVIFAAIFFLILLHDLWQILRSSPMQLLRSENIGEKPPRANYLFALAGIVLLGTAYYIAISIEEPLEAMLWFFVAVIMVIVATYLLFISGSVTMCRLLQKNKRFYYQTKHFVSVSSMAYRMKRSGAGLASICILCTMVLVTVSSTVSLYIGIEDSLVNRYPHNINIRIRYNELDEMTEDSFALLRSAAQDVLDKHTDVQTTGTVEYKLYSFDVLIKDGDLTTGTTEYSATDYSSTSYVYVASLADYNRLTGSSISLSEDEALIYYNRQYAVSDTLSLNGGNSLHIVKRLTSSPFSFGGSATDAVAQMLLIVTDPDAFVKPLQQMANFAGNRIVDFFWHYGIDLIGSNDAQTSASAELYQTVRSMYLDGSIDGFACESRAEESVWFYSTYGILFFLGILLGAVFLCAAVLIMYYKQLSEGYEDQNRFGILQKVGMTKQEIQQSVNSQILLVFFLPLAAAVLHLSFAFPMIRRILLIFDLSKIWLYLFTTVMCVVLFAVLYTLAYRVTSRTYYRIVSRMPTTQDV